MELKGQLGVRLQPPQPPNPLHGVESTGIVVVAYELAWLNPLHGVERIMLIRTSFSSGSTGIHYMELKVSCIGLPFSTPPITRIHYMELKGETGDVELFVLQFSGIHYMELKDHLGC